MRSLVCRHCGFGEKWPLAREIASHGPDELVWTLAEARAAESLRLGEHRPCEVRDALPKPEPVLWDQDRRSRRK